MGLIKLLNFICLSSLALLIQANKEKSEKRNRKILC